jgi:opacity protein-like surface antigen
MKKIFTAILLVTGIAHGAQAQRWGSEVGMNYVYTSPLGSMQHNIKQGNGLVVDLGMVTPSKRFAIGMEVQYTQYGHDESLQEYDLDDGTRANMNVVVNNSFLNFMAYGRAYLITEGKFLPYITAKGGYTTYRTDLNIYDPNEWDNCAPVESDLLQKDGTMIAALGAGFRLDMATVFRRSDPGRFYLDFNSSITQGGTGKIHEHRRP